MLGPHLLKSWSSTQQNVALSSVEAESYGVVKGASIGLGFQSMLKGIGLVMPLVVHTDSSAAETRSCVALAERWRTAGGTILCDFVWCLKSSISSLKIHHLG